MCLSVSIKKKKSHHQRLAAFFSFVLIFWGEEGCGTRTERGVIVSSDVAFCALYHDHLVVLVPAIDEAVHVHSFEGVTVLCGNTTYRKTESQGRERVNS
jgi:hypothetical protein